MKNLLVSTALLTGLALSASGLQAQNHKCATMDILEQRIQKDPSVRLRMQQSRIETQKWIASQAQPTAQSTENVIFIPVVVHIIYHEAIENISDTQIQSQIDILNQDFRKLNADRLPSSHPFAGRAADARIEFRLANRDPEGEPMTGVTRTFTNIMAFSGKGEEKSTATGGHDNWDPTKYLNLWVCNLSASDGTLGYAAFPSDLASDPKLDGVVIRYEAFGNTGTAGMGDFEKNNGGRTVTHEVGHWLNLLHIWGDNQPQCGDDEVADTPAADSANYGTPEFPHNAFNACGSDANGIMYMNYMDYVDDTYMNMFTIGQAGRMQAALNGPRSSLLTSTGYVLTSVSEAEAPSGNFSFFPNPGNGNFTITGGAETFGSMNVTVYDVLGSKIQVFENITALPFRVSLEDVSNGVYYLRIECGTTSSIRKFTINK